MAELLQDRFQKMRVSDRPLMSVEQDAHGNKRSVRNYQRNDSADETAWGEEKDQDLTQYLSEADDIKEQIKDARDMTAYCQKKLQGTMYVEVLSEADKKEVAGQLTKASELSTTVRIRIQKLRTMNAQMTAQSGSDGQGDVRGRMRASVLASWVKSFSTLLKELETVSELLVRKTGTTFEFTEMEASSTAFGGGTIQVAQDKVFASLAHQYQKEMEQEIKNLEKSVVELHQLFVDVATLLDAQGAQLDMIEPALFDTIKATESSLHMLQAAEAHKKSSRIKKAIIIAVIGITLLLIIAAGVAIVCIIAGV